MTSRTSRIHYKIDIPLPIAKFFVRKWIINDLIPMLINFLFDDRKWTHGFAEKLKRLCMNGNFACPRAEYKSFDADDIADVHQLETDHKLHQDRHASNKSGFSLSNPAVAERSFPHSPQRHYPSSN